MVSASDFIAPCCFSSVVLFFVCIIFVVVLFSFMKKKRFRSALQYVASQTGCSFDPGGWFRSPRVSGNYRNRNLLIEVYREHHHHQHHGRSSTSSTEYTKIQVNHTATLPLEMEVYPGTFFSAIGKKLGMQDIQTGNPEFDKVFVVKGSDESVVRQILDLELQAKLLKLRASVHVYPSMVYSRMIGLVSDKDFLLNIVNAMVDIADKLERLR
ncbi:MAG: DUF3137 domain-containing protein [Candidatus Altiarchaeota archaeon]